MLENGVFAYDAGIIGIGRVGLPLAISLAGTGLGVIGFDIDPHTISMVNERRMPFCERGFDELLSKVPLLATDDFTRIGEVRNIIITVGTPLRPHLESDISQLERVLRDIAPHLREGHNVMLRSTVAPGTTALVRKRLERMTGLAVGKQIFLSICPERIAEGRALEELYSLPQIIGSEDMVSFQKAGALFGNLSPEIMRTDYVTAELVKTFNNVSRYVYFAVANQFAIIAEQYGVSVYDVLELANRNYPRKINAMPGFTAGTCLRKDFGMLVETHPYSDLFVNAWRINEFMPKFLIDRIKIRTELSGKNAAILGYTFKQDTDDTRDSLVPKLHRYLEREAPAEIRIHEPLLPDRIDDRFNAFRSANDPLEQAIEAADVIFIAVNHRAFRERFAEIAERAKAGAWFADLWNVGGTGKVFYQKLSSGEGTTLA